MAKYQNNRIYYEKMNQGLKGFDDYALEIIEVAKLGTKNALHIHDYVYFNKENSSRLCDFHITVSDETQEKENLLIRQNWWTIINEKLRESTVLSLGIWKYQKEAINFIKSNFIILDEFEDMEQLFYKLKITTALVEFLSSDSFSDKTNQLKWFSFTLSADLENEKKNRYVLNSTHFGRDTSVYSIDGNEVESMLEILDGNLLYINIVPTVL